MLILNDDGTVLGKSYQVPIAQCYFKGNPSPPSNPPVTWSVGQNDIVHYRWALSGEMMDLSFQIHGSPGGVLSADSDGALIKFPPGYRLAEHTQYNGVGGFFNEGGLGYGRMYISASSGDPTWFGFGDWQDRLFKAGVLRAWGGCRFRVEKF